MPTRNINNNLNVLGDGAEIFLKSADHNVARIIPRGTGGNLDKGLLSLFDTGTEDVRIDTAGNSWFNGGNVGIGTGSPAAKLDVSVTSGNAWMNLINGSETAFRLTTYNNGTNNGTNAYAFKHGLYYNTTENAAVTFYRGGGSTGGFLTFTTNAGSERMRISSTGNVGIGTTSPSEKLHVDGKIRATNWFQGNGGTNTLYSNVASGTLLQTAGSTSNNNDSKIYFRNSGGNIKQTFDTSSGNVGIGNASPQAKLHITGTVNTDDTKLYLTENTNLLGGYFKYNGDANINFIGGLDTTERPVISYPRDGSTLSLSTGSSTALHINSSRNVGIGTSSPEAHVHIYSGNSNQTATNVQGLFLENNGSSNSYYAFQIATAVGKSFSITNAGNVGIGTTSPAQKLHVNGNVDIDNGGILLQQGYGTNFGVSGYDIVMPTTTRLGIKTAGGERMSILNNGYVGIGVTTPSRQLVVANSMGLSGTHTYIFGGDNEILAGQDGSAYYYATGNGQNLTKPVFIGDNNSYIRFNSGNAERMRITSAGEVLIGRSSNVTSQKLQVNGFIDITDVTGSALRWYDGSTFRGGLGLDDWATSNSAADLTLYGVNNLHFVSGGGNNRRMTIHSGGNVGIGTISPTKALDVRAEARVWNGSNGIELSYSTGNGSGIVASANTSGTLEFRTNIGAAAKMFIANAGNVGIGTTSPYSVLQVGDTEQVSPAELTIASRYNGGGPMINFRSGHPSNSNVWNMGRILCTDDGNYNGRLEFRTTASGGHTGTQPATRMVIKATGNVGIGTTSPYSKLHVEGNTPIIQIRETSGAAEAGISINHAVSGNHVNFFIGTLDGNARKLTIGGTITDGHSTNTAQAAASLMLIDEQTGKVGIGTTSPSEKLHVQGAVGTTNGTAALPTHTFYSDNDTGMYRAAVNTLAFSTDGNERLRINSSGDVGIGGTSAGAKLEIHQAQVTTQFDRDCFLRLHPTATTDSGGFTNIMFGTSVVNNYGVAIGGKRAGTDGTPSFSIRMLNDSITGTEVLNITNSGNATFAGAVTANGLKSPYLESASTNQSLFIRPNGSGHVYLGDSGNGTNLYHYSNANNGQYTTYGWGNYYTISTTAPSGIKIDDPLTVAGVITATGGNSTNWNTAYSWGNHASAGYLTSSSTQSKYLRSDANDSFSGNLTNNGSNHITFGPNSTWSNYLRIGGNGYQGNSTTANIASTNGNLHLDAAATSRGLYLNYYAGNQGVAFGNGATTNVAWMGPDGDLWKGSSDNTGSKYWHAGNMGTGSNLDADSTDGLHVHNTQGTQNSANAILRTQANGYTKLGWIETTSGDIGSGIPSRIYTSTDSYVRYADLASFRSLMNVTARASFQGREQVASDQNYWVGTMGWGTVDFDTIFGYGSGHIDSWSSPTNQPSTETSHWVGHQSMHYTNGSNHYGHQFLVGAGNPAYCYLRGKWGGTTYSWAKMWNSANDGSGSGLDADTLDGYEGSYYATTNDLALKLNLSGGTMTGHLNLGDSDRVKLGQGGDLQFVHDGSNSYIHNVSVGDLYLRQTADNKNIILESDNGSGGSTAYLTINGSTERIENLKNVFHYDNVRAQFGDGADLQIYHDSSHSYIDDSGTGNLNIKSNSLRLLGANSTSMLVAHQGGAVNLYHDNSAKLATTASGIYVAGNVQLLDSSSASDGRITFGNGNDLQIYHDGSNSYIRDGGAGELIISGGQYVQIKYDSTTAGGLLVRDGDNALQGYLYADGASTPNFGLLDGSGSWAVKCRKDEYVQLLYDGAIKLQTASGGVTVTGQLSATTGSFNNGVGNGSGPCLSVGGSGDIQASSGGSLFFGAYNYASSTYIRGHDSGTGLQFFSDGQNLMNMTSSLVSISALTVSGVTTLSGNSNHYAGHHFFDPYDSSGNHYPHYMQGTGSSSAKVNIRVYNAGGGSFDTLYIAAGSNNMTWRGNKIWNAGNDGSGSGLDADTVDGIQGSSFLRSDTSDTSTGGLTTNFFRTNASTTSYSLITRDTGASNYVLYVQSPQSGGTQKIATFGYGSANAGQATEVFRIARGNINAYSSNLTVGGTITGTSKNFSIPHPTKEGKRLIHSCIEGPEVAVYFRGRSQSSTIEMPDYWGGLVDLDSMTVELTAIGPNQDLYVEDIADDGEVTVGSNTETSLNYFYVVYGERKDIDKLEVEIEDTGEFEAGDGNSEE